MKPDLAPLRDNLEATPSTWEPCWDVRIRAGDGIQLWGVLAIWVIVKDKGRQQQALSCELAVGLGDGGRRQLEATHLPNSQDSWALQLGRTWEEELGVRPSGREQCQPRWRQGWHPGNRTSSPYCRYWLYQREPPTTACAGSAKRRTCRSTVREHPSEMRLRCPLRVLPQESCSAGGQKGSAGHAAAAAGESRLSDKR